MLLFLIIAISKNFRFIPTFPSRVNNFLSELHVKLDESELKNLIVYHTVTCNLISLQRENLINLHTRGLKIVQCVHNC